MASFIVSLFLINIVQNVYILNFTISCHNLNLIMANTNLFPTWLINWHAPAWKVRTHLCSSCNYDHSDHHPPNSIPKLKLIVFEVFALQDFEIDIWTKDTWHFVVLQSELITVIKNERLKGVVKVLNVYLHELHDQNMNLTLLRVRNAMQLKPPLLKA